MITLYHGSNCDVTKPIPMKGRRGTDFGQGFYLTPDMDSARSMASLVTRRQGDGIKTISVFEFDIDAASIAGLAIRQFESMDADWMSFVLANRCFDRSAPDHNIDQLYDVVIGFIADDKIRNMIRLYRSGLMKQDDVLKTMQEAPWRVVQYSFHTPRSTRFLTLREIWHEQ